MTSRIATTRLNQRRGVVALEFAIVSIPLIVFMLGLFEVSYDLYVQSALDSGLQKAVRQIATGNAQNVVSANSFVSNYLCPDVYGLLECGNKMLVSINAVTLGTNSAGKANDFYAYTTGKLPLAGNTLILPASYSQFCNATASQALVITAIYAGPTFLGGLLTGLYSVYYNGMRVHATMATRGVITEQFPVSAPGNGTVPAGSCAAS